MIAQRPPALIKGNARAAQKSLHGNVAHDRVGENCETRGEKIRKAVRLGGIRLRVGDQPRGAQGAFSPCGYVPQARPDSWGSVLLWESSGADPTGTRAAIPARADSAVEI